MKKITIIAMILSFGLASATTPVMAETSADTSGNAIGAENANILDKCAEESGKDSIICLLKLGVNILSVGVGILGVIGISVSGVHYLTAAGSEEKTRKAKRRLFEIVIGLAAYAVMYFLLAWLLPSVGR